MDNLITGFLNTTTPSNNEQPTNTNDAQPTNINIKETPIENTPNNNKEIPIKKTRKRRTTNTNKNNTTARITKQQMENYYINKIKAIKLKNQKKITRKTKRNVKNLLKEVIPHLINIHKTNQ
jgi:hypothetical protein